MNARSYYLTKKMDYLDIHSAVLENYESIKIKLQL